MTAVEIVEVGPRDGLQNEKMLVAADDKLRLITALADCGLKRIEAAACVSPKAVPQMADSAEVIARLPQRDGVSYSALVPNMRGLQTALTPPLRLNEIAVFTGASESFVRANINCTIAESMAMFEPVVAAAKARNLRARGYVSAAVFCPYDGAIPPAAAADVAAKLYAIGCDEISIADTIGKGEPENVRALLRAVMNEIPRQSIAVHFHDTYGAAIKNVACALENGIGIIDAAVAGLGGCPFAPGAPGNVATESVVSFLRQQGIDTGIDEDKLMRAGEFIRGKISR